MSRHGIFSEIDAYEAVGGDGMETVMGAVTDSEIMPFYSMSRATLWYWRYEPAGRVMEVC